MRLRRASWHSGDTLIERRMAETGLPRGRIEGERIRTVDQHRLFANVVGDGGWLAIARFLRPVCHQDLLTPRCRKPCGKLIRLVSRV
jgi:hypothetical protein